LVGNRPCDGPGSTPVSGKNTINESANTPFERIASVKVNGVFWKKRPMPPRTTERWLASTA
jgi:hypothetical protein